ncbi:hypothetical protein [Streptomyces sp. NPDC056987]|uniref:AraC-like ligand-binding domain-containing protein n=1 Tax=Streptomyces sp. NPDC056987 TaxID=3345988 RepID=UPI00363A9CDA
MLETVFHTDDVPAGMGADAYVEGLSRLHAPVAVVSSADEGFWAYKRIVEMGRVSLYTTGLDSLTIRRTPRMIRQSDPEMYNLALITRGTTVLTFDGRDRVYGPLELRTGESSRPFELRMDSRGERVEAICVDVPKAVLPLPRAMADRVIWRPLDGRGGVGALFAGFLTTLAANTRSYTAADVPRLETVLTDLLATLFAHELDTLDAPRKPATTPSPCACAPSSTNASATPTSPQTPWPRSTTSRSASCTGSSRRRLWRRADRAR